MVCSLNHLKMKTKLILVAVTVVLSYIGIGYFMNESFEESDTIISGYKARQVVRDSTIAGYKRTLHAKREEVKLLIIEKEYYRVKVDGTLAVIESLTRPKVTSQVIEESLQWVKHYNDSLSYSPSLLLQPDSALIK